MKATLCPPSLLTGLLQCSATHDMSQQVLIFESTLGEGHLAARWRHSRTHAQRGVGYDRTACFTAIESCVSQGVSYSSERINKTRQWVSWFFVI